MDPQLAFYICLASLGVGLLIFQVSTNLSEGANAYSSKFTKSSEATLAEMLVFMPPTAIMSMKLSCLALGLAAGWVVSLGLKMWWQQLIPMFFIGIPAFYLPDSMIKKAYRKRLKTFHLQMIDGLTIIMNSLKANLSFPDSIRVMSEEAEEPLASEFALVLQEVNLGLPMERALDNLSKRMPIDDLALFVASINTIYSMGSGLRVVCQNAIQLISQRFRVEMRIEAITSEGRMQALVLAMAPYLLMFVLYFIDPSLTETLFNTGKGMIILGIVIILDLLGFLFIRNITNIEV